MNINDSFPSNYVKASDLGDKEPVVTIREVKTEAVGRNKEIKLVVYFEKGSKGMVLNKTNAKKIAELVDSEDTDDWPGHQIRLHATTTEFAGEEVECIRIKSVEKTPKVKLTEKKPAAVVAGSVSDPLTEDDIPF